MIYCPFCSLTYGNHMPHTCLKFLTVVVILVCQIVALAGAVANENPFAAHNAYPWRLYPKDRFERALNSGLKHLEVDITYDPERHAVVATHDAKPTGGEPELPALLEPLWTKWGASPEEGYTLILDFKSSSDEVVRGVKQLLDEHAELLSSLRKGSTDFKPGKITVCLTGNGAAHALYDRLIAAGEPYRAFSDDTGCPGSWQNDPTTYVPDQPAGYVRFVTLEKQNFLDAPRARGDHHVSISRLRAAVDAANAGGYRIRVYTLNPARRGDGWDTLYWDACLAAGVHMIATDAYDLAHEHWQAYEQQQPAAAR
jgi:hypothetical protein